ncbi:thiol-disulfide oxidoreductase DCC family protein [Gracilibacillus suaedae]|uniref:thiol-disulfide oxidoreductase DCC family protein n=1 Tax=Gracilibacillus suaedae TaxID=2820273 RepID=UPI001ABE69C2|nr:DCC1-like thiol-disulfide oxidoreductase family protein [Gracilibacillus suaedae]
MVILVYDGECNFCSKFIKFLLKINKNSSLRVTSFNSKWYNEFTIKNGIKDNVDSIILINSNRMYVYSDAILHVIVQANKLFIPLFILKIIPKPIRDFFYKIVAKYRKKLSKPIKCSLPSQNERKYFL